MTDAVAWVPAGTLAGFVAASMVLTLAPGPDVLFLAALSARDGALRGAMLAFGLALGNLVHTALAAAGVTAVLAASPRGFAVVRFAGVAYLLYLALDAWRGERRRQARRRVPRLPASRLVGRGMAMNVMNPKVMLLFLAFFPQFVNPSRGPVAGQMLILGVAFTLQVVIVFGTVALLSGRLGRRLGAAGGGPVGALFRCAVITLYLALALKLALTTAAP